jgi:hypothetical protein
MQKENNIIYFDFLSYIMMIINIIIKRRIIRNNSKTKLIFNNFSSNLKTINFIKFLK